MKKIYKVYTIMLFAIGISGCKKSFLSQEVNPNAPSVASPQNLLTGAETISAGIINGGSSASNYYAYCGVWMGQVCPSGNYVPSAVLETYNFTNTSFQVFVPLYNNLANYNALISQTIGTTSLAYFTAIAQIMSVYDYQQLVDNYGNVPYSQALNSSQYLFPAYDDASGIYDNLLVKLDAAIALAQTSGATSPGTSDVIFNGAMSNWIKFANSLKLRIAIRQYTNVSSKDAALKASVAKTASLGFLDDNTFATANPGYSTALEGQQSPFYYNYGFSVTGATEYGNQYYRANAYEVNLLKTYNDPRLTLIFAPNSAGNVVGNVLGSDATNSTNAVASAIGPGLLKSPSMNAVIFSGSEACFLLSEGIIDGLVTGATGTTTAAGSAGDYYQRGITASFVALGVPNATGTTGAAATYYAQASANISWAASSANFIQAIIIQKYIALTGYGWFEIYNEYRRTGYPSNLPRSTAAGALGTGPAPSRIYYPSTEYQQNASSVPDQSTINVFTTKIFWATH